MSLSDFEHALGEEPLDLFHIGLLIARNLAYPDLVPATYEQRLDAIVRAAQTAGVAHGSQAEQAEALLHFLHEHEGLHGDETVYDDPRSSFLNEVLDRRRGLPIALAVLYIAVARRLGMDAHGIGMPGHFISGVGGPNEVVYIDLFNGMRLSGSDCVRLMRTATGFTGPFRTHWLAPTPPADIVLRMLNNLRLLYVRREAWEQAAVTLDHMALVRPDLPDIDRDRGLIAFARGRLPSAAQLLERYMADNPNAPDLALLQRTVGPALARWARRN